MRAAGCLAETGLAPRGDGGGSGADASRRHNRSTVMMRLLRSSAPMRRQAALPLICLRSSRAQARMRRSFRSLGGTSVHGCAEPAGPPAFPGLLPGGGQSPGGRVPGVTAGAGASRIALSSTRKEVIREAWQDSDWCRAVLRCIWRLGCCWLSHGLLLRNAAKQVQPRSGGAFFMGAGLMVENLVWRAGVRWGVARRAPSPGLRPPSRRRETGS